MTAEPLYLSKQEVLMKLWEARERLEARALDAEDQKTHREVEAAVDADVAAKKATMPSTKAVVSDSPNLMSPEVTRGLERLLNEWPYFKGSGMLGFGPGGKEHPMYRRIADIPVRYVLTGRFDDPDQELINEVREYVGGWRREQGVDPQEEETFEHYLRRVIATILNKQAIIDARTSTT